MALPAELDRIVKNIEHENQQLIKLIEQENQQIEAIEKETEYEKERTARLKESNSQLDEEIKRYHKQFIHLRDNCESLKKTAVILTEHEEVMVKKLDQVVIESERERIERDEILHQYRGVWDDYHSTYESFPEVRRLRSLQDELAEVEQIRLTIDDQVNQLRTKIKEKQEQKESARPPFATMEQFIVKVAEMKIGTMRVEQELHQMCQEKRDVTRQIMDVREQLKTIEEERLINMAITDQEKSKHDEMEKSHTNYSGQQDHEVMSIDMQPAVLPVDHKMQSSQGLMFQQRKSPPKLLFPGMEEETTGTLQVTISQNMKSVSQHSQASRSSMPQVSMPPQLLMPRPPALRTQGPSQSSQLTMPRPPQVTTPIIPQSPQLTMPRLPQVMTPRPSPQLTMPRPQTTKLMMPRPSSYVPKVVTTPKVQLPQRARSTLPLDMIGTPGKSKDLPANVDTPQLAPPRPADFPRVSLPMEMIGNDGGRRIPMTASCGVTPRTPARVVPRSNSMGYDGDTTITPERPDTTPTAKTPKTPGDQGIRLDPEDSPFDVEKHLWHLSELKSRSPGFTFSSRPMVQREAAAEMNQTSTESSFPATTFHGEKSTTSTSAASANPLNFGFNTEPNTNQHNFNFGTTESPANGAGFNFGRGDATQGPQQNNFSFGLGFGAGGDNATSGNIFSIFGDGSKDETPQSPQAGFSFSGFGDQCASPSFNAGSGFNLF